MRDEGQDFGHSLTDLMASVAVMFLLIAAIFMVRSLSVAKKAKQELDAATQSQQTDFDKLERLRDALLGLEVLEGIAEVRYSPKVDPGLLTLVISDRQLGFEPGQCRPRAEGIETIRTKLPVILTPMCRMLEEFDESVAQITLEGHTDATPFFPARPTCGIEPNATGSRCGAQSWGEHCDRLGFENNVRLSGARAQNVYFELREAVAGLPTLMSCLESRFVVSGRGPVEPLNGGDWKAARTREEMQEDRRVVIKVRVSPRVRFATVAGTEQ